MSNDNQVLIKNTNIQGSPTGLGVTGGYNISIAGGSADGNIVDVIADSEYGEANLVINKFISGGLIGSVGTADRVGNTNNNQVTLTNTRGNGKLEINGYVAGGANFATGIGDASGNKVFINPPQTGENYLIDIKEYVLGGLVGTAGTGKTNKNLVSIQNSHVTQYITGGYNQGAGQVSASENEVYLKGVSLYDSGVVNGRFVVGGLLSNSEGTGDAYKNKVVLEKSKFTGKYIAGGVEQTLPSNLRAFGQMPWDIILALVACVVAYIFLNYTKIGTYTYAIGSDEFVAKNMGINVNKYKVLAFILSGAFLGVMAILTISYGSSMVAVTGMASMSRNFVPTMGCFFGLAFKKYGMPLPAIIIGEFVINIIFFGFIALGAPTAIQDVITGLALLIIITVTTKATKGEIVK